MNAYALPSRAAWHAEGLRWIAALLNQAADRLEQPAAPVAEVSQPSHHVPLPEDYLSDVRWRMLSRTF